MLTEGPELARWVRRRESQACARPSNTGALHTGQERSQEVDSASGAPSSPNGFGTEPAVFSFPAWLIFKSFLNLFYPEEGTGKVATLVQRRHSCVCNHEKVEGWDERLDRLQSPSVPCPPGSDAVNVTSQ